MGYEQRRDAGRRWLVAVAGLGRNVVVAGGALAAVVLLVAGALLVPVAGLGVPVLAGTLPAVRRLAGAQRRWAARTLGTPVPDPYRPDDGRLRTRLRDPATWRDIGWLGIQVPVAAVLGLLPVALTYAAFVVATKPKDLAGRVVEALGAALLVLVAAWLVPRLCRAEATVARRLLAPTDRAALARRVAGLAASRAAVVDARAAELRRIERDLHDGAQARLVSLSINLGLAERSIADDPAQARVLVAEARTAAGRALADLRDLVRGIHPPVLADRGLAGAVEAAALLCPVPVEVHVDLAGRPPPPVESAVYFAALEALTNVARHSAATRASARLTHTGDALRLVVTDDGRGGADPARGSGLSGIRSRLSAFDGALTLDSPDGGPTQVTMEVPCALSSPRTRPSSGTA